MYGFTSLFLITAVFFSVCTIGNSKHKVKCQNEVMKLECLNKSYVIKIESAFYGRKLPGFMICRSHTHLADEIKCDMDVLARVKELCEWKNSCNFTINEETLGKDPQCQNVFKYMDVEPKCVNSQKYIREAVKVVSPTPLVVMATSSVTSSSKAMTSQMLTTEAIQPTSTLVANVDRLSTVYQSEEATNTTSSSSLSSSRPHSVSVTTVSHTQRLSATSVVIETPSFKTTKPASKTYEKSATLADQHGTMKLFRFILSFHVIREEHIHKHTASSVVWFMFGLLVGLFIMIAVLVYYRVKRARRERQNKPCKAAYVKQKDCSDGTLEEKVILHPKELEALEMESQLGETV